MKSGFEIPKIPSYRELLERLVETENLYRHMEQLVKFKQKQIDFLETKLKQKGNGA